MTELQQLQLPIHPNALLKEYTTFRLGGPCMFLIECLCAEDVTKAAISLRTKNIPFILMGFGSNILVSDDGIERIVLRYSNNIPIIEQHGCLVTVDAATQFDHLIAWSIQEGLEGLSAMSGIPGTVGGAIAGNAGAYGQQITDRMINLTLLRPDNTIMTAPKSMINFTYRDSELKHNGNIALRATFELKPSTHPEELQKERAEKIEIRGGKHGSWQENPCAGSFFKNIEPISSTEKRQAAGHFLEQAGAKELRVGKAHTYPKHANIVTHDGATAQDVYELTLKMAAAVKEKFGFDLVREVRLLGKFQNAPGSDPKGFW